MGAALPRPKEPVALEGTGIRRGTVAEKLAILHPCHVQNPETALARGVEEVVLQQCAGFIALFIPVPCEHDSQLAIGIRTRCYGSGSPHPVWTAGTEAAHRSGRDCLRQPVAAQLHPGSSPWRTPRSGGSIDLAGLLRSYGTAGGHFCFVSAPREACLGIPGSLWDSTGPAADPGGLPGNLNFIPENRLANPSTSTPPSRKIAAMGCY